MAVAKPPVQPDAPPAAPPPANDVTTAPAPSVPMLEFVELADLKPAARAANPLDAFVDKRVAILAFETTMNGDDSAIIGGKVTMQEISGSGLVGQPADIEVGRRMASALEKRLSLAPEGKIVAATVKREKRSVTLV